jgi:hypothetical protein
MPDSDHCRRRALHDWGRAISDHSGMLRLGCLD